MSGSLFVVATPIGNLEDISIRAINTLKEVDFIVAEDTRITSRLLKKYNINKSLISFHINNETRKVNKIINYLNEDKKIALVSDAGTPCISDPGYRLISYIKKKHPEIGVISIPGPSASTASLSISGWSFVFGIILFSGSLYILAITGIKSLGIITPIGGVLFIIGWVFLIIKV